MSVAPFARTNGRPSVEGVAGSLASLSLAELCQTLSLSTRSARVRMFEDDAEGDVWFVDGIAVHARTGQIEGEEAFFALLRWRNGRFEIRDDARPPRQSLSGDPMYLVLEGLRRIDEEDDTSEEPAATPDPGGAAPRRRRFARTLLVVAVGLAVAAAAVAGWLWFERSPGPASGTEVAGPVETPAPRPIGLARGPLDPSALPTEETVPPDEEVAHSPTDEVETPEVLVEDRAQRPVPSKTEMVLRDREPAAPIDPAAVLAELPPGPFFGPITADSFATVPPGTLVVEVVSRVESGRLSVRVDGDTWLDRDVAWDAGAAKRVFRRIAGRDGDRFEERVTLPPGAHELVAVLDLGNGDGVRELRYGFEIDSGTERAVRLVALRKRGGRLEIREAD